MRNVHKKIGQVPRQSSGQAMILSVMLLTTGILGAASIVGLLMIYEIRYTGDVVSSAQAVFAADAGIECASYQHYKDSTYLCGTEAAPIALSNGATFRVELKTVGLKEYAISYGRSKSIGRAFQLEF